MKTLRWMAILVPVMLVVEFSIIAYWSSSIRSQAKLSETRAAWTPEDVAAEEVTGEDPELLDEAAEIKVAGVSGSTKSKRSPKWAATRERFAKQFPDCAACGAVDHINVHHVIPFHEDKELELDPTNLITLCRYHHFHIGHDRDGLSGPGEPNWNDSNPNVRQECAAFRSMLQGIEQAKP